MSSLLSPVGPQAPRVYWVRRVVVLVVLVALLLGLRWLLVGRSASSATTGAASPSVSSTPAVSSSATPARSTATAKPTTSKTATATPSGSSTSAAAGPQPCPKADIAVTASTDAATYPVGSTPRLRMRIQNVGSKACTRDIGAGMNTLLITSGSAHVWSSDDCNPGGSPQVATLQPGSSYSVSVTWLGRLSQKGCPSGQPLAQKGSYTLVGSNGDVSSAGAAFSLT